MSGNDELAANTSTIPKQRKQCNNTAGRQWSLWFVQKIKTVRKESSGK